MPVELSVRFTSDEKQPDSPIQVSLFRSDSGAYTNPAPFTPPLTDDDLDEIRWYLEDYSTWPTEVDRLRAERIERNLESAGNAMRTAVVQGEDGARLWQQFIDDPDSDKLLTIDATDPRVLRLPWELLADTSGHIFARKIGVRRRLSEATRAALPALSVFQGGALEGLILAITEIDPDRWKSARAELEAPTLVTVENIQGFVSPFLHFHPALMSNLGESMPSEQRISLETRFWQRYYNVSGVLYHSDTSDPQHIQVRAMALLEMPNLQHAFDLAMAAALRGETDEFILTDFAEYVVKFLDIFGRNHELDALRRKLNRLPTFIREFLDEKKDETARGEQAQDMPVCRLIDQVGQVERHETPPGNDHEVLYWITERLALDQQEPRELRALGNVLHKVLAGSRAPDLAWLSDDHALLVQAMLGTLKGA